MKKLCALLLLLSILLLFCACQTTEDIDSYTLDSPSVQLYTIPITKGSFPTHPAPTTFVMPENCDNGHTFLNEARYCSVCGAEYYSVMLMFRAYEEGYKVCSLNKCERIKVVVPSTYNGLPVIAIRQMYTMPGGTHEKVTHVVLPDSIREIDATTFNGYMSLISINIPEAVTRIEANTFHACHSLETIEIPAGVTYIGEYAFGDCFKLKQIDLPEGLTELGGHAFAGCESLEEFVIPNGITEISNYLLSYCYSLKKVTYADAVTKIGQGAFRDCTSLPNAVIGENVVEIGKLAFSGCIAIQSVVIPESVKVIGAYAFRDCENLEYIVIGSGVEELGDDLFKGCTKLQSIYYHGTQEQWMTIKQMVSISGSTYTAPKFNGRDIYFYSETKPTQPGNYWRYVDGIPTPWETEE